jgi:predicted metal-dependent hydrolase
MGRKTRSDSKLDNLADHHHAELVRRLLENEKYEDLLTWLAVECGVSSSLASLSSFFKRHCAPVLHERRQLAVIRAAEFSKAAEESPMDWDEVAMEKLKQIFFELLLQPDVDPATAKKFGDMLLKDKALSMDSRRLKIVEAKAKRLEEAKKDLEERKNTGGVSAEALAEIERTLGML